MSRVGKERVKSFGCLKRVWTGMSRECNAKGLEFWVL